MQWARPEWLWLFVVLPVVGLRAWRGRERRARGWATLGQPGRPPGDGAVGWLVAAGCLIVALAGPRWGRAERPPLPPGHDVVLAVDASRSMGAEDAVPDRLGLAVETAEGLVRAIGAARGRGDRVAVVAFAGKGVRRCPLTENLGAVVDTLRELSPGAVEPGGTNLAAALDAASEAFDDQERADGRTVVLFSDGEDHGGPWRSALERAKDRGLVVHAVALGDTQPQPVPKRPRVGPSDEVLTYQGAPVGSRRTDEALSEIAAGSGGAFLPIGLATTDLGDLFRTRIEPIARARRADRRAADLAERFGPFLLAALAIGLLASRPRSASVAARRGGVVLSAGLALAAVGAGPVSLVDQGRKAYEAGRFDEALAAFSEAAEGAPESPWPRYDRAATLYQLGRFAEAEADYLLARANADGALRTKIDYALGNAAAALGRFEEAIARYDACLASGARGPGLAEVRRRASGNRAYVAERAPRGPSTGGGDGPDGPGPDNKPDGEDEPGDGPGPKGDGGRQAGAPKGQGQGGAGGPGPASAPDPGGSPASRLDKAVENVREARRRRIDDHTPPEAARDVKDW